MFNFSKNLHIVVVVTHHKKYLIIMTHCRLIHPVRLNAEFSAVPARQVIAILAQLALDVIRVLFLDLSPELVHAENTNILVKWSVLSKISVLHRWVTTHHFWSSQNSSLILASTDIMSIILIGMDLTGHAMQSHIQFTKTDDK